MASKKNGFTLVELAIVIVIIGLLVGGVLQGQELIHQAKLRRLMTDINGYKAGAVTFYGKYNCMPGDCPFAFRVLGAECGTNAAITTNGTGCNGNGDRNLTRNEGRHFWKQLSISKIIKGTYLATVSTLQEGTFLPKTTFNSYVSAIFSKGNKVSGPECGFQYCDGMELGGMNDNIFMISESEINEGLLFSPVDLFQFDLKFDDGKYFSGNISATSGRVASAGIMTYCGSDTTNAYFSGQGTVNGIPIRCPLAFRMGL